MSNIFRLTPALHAPIVLEVSTAGSSGGPWDDDGMGGVTELNASVVAWYDKQETDGDFCGLILGGALRVPFTPAALNSRLTYNFRRLSKVPFDHLSCYLEQNDGFSAKLVPISGTALYFGNLPPYAQSASFDDVTDGTTNLRQVPIVSVTGRQSASIISTDSATRKIVLADDWTDDILVGDVIWVDGSGVGNDGFYSVQTVTYGALTGTVITTVGAIPASSTYPGTSIAIFDTTAATSIIRVNGDITAALDVGEVISITNHATLNGDYHVTARSFGGGKTSITVTETLTDSSSDGDITYDRPGSLHFGHPVFRLAGNRKINLPDGITFDTINTAADLTGVAVESVTIAVEEGGEYTDISIVPLSTSIDYANDAVGVGQLIYSANYLNWQVAANFNTAINVSLIRGCRYTNRQLMDNTYDGRQVKKSLSRDTAIQRIDFDVEFGGITAEDFLKLCKYARHKTRLTLEDISDAGVIQFSNSFGGYLELPNELNSRNKTFNDVITFGFIVESEQDCLVDRPAGGSGEFYPQIIDVSYGANSISLHGDWTWILFKGKHIQIVDSTNITEGYYHVESSEYTAASDETALVLFGDIGSSGAADGFVRILGYE